MADQETDSALPRLNDSVALLPGIGPKRAALLSKLGIVTLRDLLFHLPRAYEDRRTITPIDSVEEGQTVTILGEVVSARNVRLRGRMSLAAVTVRDDSGRMNVTFFGRGFLANTTFRPGVRAFFTGEVGAYNGPCLKNPEYETMTGDDEDRLHTGRVVPLYPLTEGVSHRQLRRWIHAELDRTAPALKETLPASLLEAHGFPPIHDALRRVHFPEDPAEAQAARTRFAYEELLAMQLAILQGRVTRLAEEKGYRHRINGPVLKGLGKALPFDLTPAQDRVISEVLADMASPRPMARLIQGDVGCGKTMVAIHAMAAAADGGYQTALMAPTEVLAEQHHLHLRDLLAPLGLNVALLTGTMRGAKALHASVARGGIHVLVGTQALFQEATLFHRLGLVIVDEQHRFGVLQRERLVAKGAHADVLHMTATPIPRTLAITVYGGMDVSVIDALPPGRLPVKTRRIPPSKVAGMYDYIRREAEAGRQTYIICPLIEESETRDDLTALLSHYEALSDGPLAGLRTALLHGRLDPGEKEDIMRSFKAGRVDVLFSTTVIEVGVDVPAATTMVIEDAAQFGLTQLHQLRGRVGRGKDQAHCFLLGKPKTKDGAKRLDILCRHDSGFEIAEADLEMRGPGEFRGVRQAGLSDLRVADLIRDVRLLDRARRDAEAILQADPRLEDPTHRMLKETGEHPDHLRL